MTNDPPASMGWSRTCDGISFCGDVPLLTANTAGVQKVGTETEQDLPLAASGRTFKSPAEEILPCKISSCRLVLACGNPQI